METKPVKLLPVPYVPTLFMIGQYYLHNNKVNKIDFSTGFDPGTEFYENYCKGTIKMVKFYLVSEEKIRRGDLFITEHFQIYVYDDSESHNPNGLDNYYKIIATPDQIGYVRHLTKNSSFVSIFEHVPIVYIQEVLANGGRCKVEVENEYEFKGLQEWGHDMTEVPVEYQTKLVRLIDNKVIININ
jgi:hypothetical protein